MLSFAIRLGFVGLGVVLFAALAAAQRPREIWERYTIAVVGRDGSDPIYGAVRDGAVEAARFKDGKYNLETTVIDRTPRMGGPQAQVAALDRALLDGVDGVILSVADPAVVGPKVDELKRQGIPTVTVEYDAPASGRIATIQTDDGALGQAAFEQAAQRLPAWGGGLAILTSDSESPRLRARREAIERAAAGHPKVEIVRTFASAETVDAGIQAVRDGAARDRDEQIDGWIFLGSWPLEGVADLPWEPGERVCVAIEALPPMLPYLAKGEVDALVGEAYFEWGFLAMGTLLEHIHQEVPAPGGVVTTGPKIVTRENLADYGADWAAWMQ